MGVKGAQAREKNPMWKGGRSVASNGYVLVRVGTDHHLADVRGYAYEHRLVAEKKIGRRLLPTEDVHHRDGNKQNNAPENLDVVTRAEHRFEHREKESGLRKPGEANATIPCGCGCGEKLAKYDTGGRPRTIITGHNSKSQASPTRYAILAALANGPLQRADLIAKTGLTKQAVAVGLTKLKKSGRIESCGRGRWQLPEQKP